MLEEDIRLLLTKLDDDCNGCNKAKEKINYDHIYNDFYWSVVALIGFALLLFFLILVLICTFRDNDNK